MISVPNLRQPLSGNKWFLFGGIFLILGFSSCDLFKKAETGKGVIQTGEELDPIQGRRVYDPVSGTYVTVDEEVVMEKMDTIIWKDIPASTYPPITSEGVIVQGGKPTETIRVTDFGSEILSSYNVSVLLPFLKDRFNPQATAIYDNSLWALNFYAGLKMALDVLSEEGVKLNVDVKDTGASEQAVSGLLRNNQDLAATHMIIGPYRRDNVALVAEFAKKTEKVLVSPYSASSRISENNPNYIQVNPSLQTHCEGIMRHALARFNPSQIILVSKGKPNESARFDYFKDEYLKWARGRPVPPLQELIISDESADLNNIDLLPFIDIRDTTVFIVPNWDETFVYSLLRKIDVSRDPTDFLVVYGMPQWRDFERIDFDYYEKLNVRISSSFFLDPLSPEVRLFKQRFFDRFGTIPREEAYVGYDVMLYFGRMLNRFGTKFQYALEGQEANMLHTRFAFERLVIPTTTSGIERPRIDQFENKYISILQFKDYQFQLDE